MSRNTVAIAMLIGLPVVGARGQSAVVATASVTSGYVWRGVTLTNRPAIQPGLELRHRGRGLTVSVAGWGNVDAGRYDDALALSQSGGGSALDLSEFDGTVTVSGAVGPATLAGGAIWYLFPNPATLTGFNPDANTVELFARIGFGGVLSPAVAVFYDVDKIRGAYLEGSAGHRFDRALGTRPLQLSLIAGFSAGQDAELDGAGTPTAPFYSFETNGLTHLDLAIGTDFRLLGLSVAPAAHLVFGRDRAAKHVDPSHSRDLKLWVGASIGWETLFGNER